MPATTLALTLMSEPGLLDHILAALGLGPPLFGALSTRKAMQETVYDRETRISCFWANGAILYAIGGLVFLGWWLADRGSPGLTQDPQNLAIANTLIAAYVAYYAYDVWRSIHSREARDASRIRMEKTTPFMPRSWGELPHALVL